MANNPWNGTELKRFWATARSAGLDSGNVYEIIQERYPGRRRLHDLTRGEFMRLFTDIVQKQVSAHDNELDTIFAGTSMEPSWLRIRWLQRQLQWSNDRLVGYILWHGRKSGRQIDSVRWLTVDKSRGIITAMEKMRRNRTYQMRQENTL